MTRAIHDLLTRLQEQDDATVAVMVAVALSSAKTLDEALTDLLESE